MSTFNAIERVQTQDIKAVFARLHDAFIKTKNTGLDIGALRAKISQERLLLEAYLESVKYSMMILQKKHIASPVSNVYAFDYRNIDIIETADNANIDTRFKYISAAIRSKAVYKDLRISIEPQSNGFPGNTHEVEDSGENVIFRGQNSPFINLSNILGNQEPVAPEQSPSFSALPFEYEFYRVSDGVMELTQNMGFHYREGKSFITRQNELILSLRFDFPAEHNRGHDYEHNRVQSSGRVINMLSISPYILSSLGYSYCDITEISVYAKDGVKYPIIDGSSKAQFKHTLTYVFPAIECSHIIIGILQPKGYNTYIGHFYNEFNGIRFETERDTLKLLGFGYNENSSELVQPNTDIQNVSTANLFPLFNKNYPIEILPAERFVIGISRIEIANCAFRPRSSIISNPIHVNGLNNFRITTNQNNYEIGYYVSFNNGSWIEADRGRVINVSEITAAEPVEETITDEDRVAHTIVHKEGIEPASVKSVSYKIEFNIQNNNIPILYDFFLETEIKDND